MNPDTAIELREAETETLRQAIQVSAVANALNQPVNSVRNQQQVGE
jgi:hypothetical protein